MPTDKEIARKGLDLDSEPTPIATEYNNSPNIITTVREQARLYAESKMYVGWDRKDAVQIATFYNHMVDFLTEKVVELWAEMDRLNDCLDNQ